METTQTERITDGQRPVRLAWHKPEVERLVISVTTADFFKDGSLVDLDTKANDFPANV